MQQFRRGFVYLDGDFAGEEVLHEAEFLRPQSTRLSAQCRQAIVCPKDDLDDRVLLSQFWHRYWIRLELSRVDGCKVCRLLRAHHKVLFTKCGLRIKGKIVGHQLVRIASNPEHMILVNTVCYLPSPNGAATSLSKSPPSFMSTSPGSSRSCSSVLGDIRTVLISASSR